MVYFMRMRGTAGGLSPDSTFAADLVGVGADRAGFLGAVAARLGENAIATKGSEFH